MTAVAGYYDDSFDDAGPVFVVAGYSGTVPMWNEFSPRWQAIVHDPKYPRMSEFKASDCRNGKSEFDDKYGWTTSLRNEVTARLVSALVECSYTDMVGYGTAVVYDRTFPLKPDKKRYHEQAFELCLAHLLAMQMETGGAVAEQSDSQMAVIVDEKSKFRHFVEEHFDRIVAKAGPGAAKRFRLELPGVSSDLMPLQAADLLAYETYREVKHRIDNKKRDKPVGVSRALERLVGGHFHRAHCIDYRLMGRIRSHLRRGVKPKRIRLKIKRIYDSEWAIRGPQSWIPQ